jgi:hypothetical protein
MFEYTRTMSDNNFGLVLTPTAYKAVGVLKKQKTKRDIKKVIKKIVPDKQKRKKVYTQTSKKIDDKVQKAQDRIMKKASFIYKRGRHSKSPVYYRKYTLGELAREKDKITRTAVFKSRKLRQDAKRLRPYNPRKADANLKKANFLMAQAKRETMLLDNRVKTIVKQNSQTLKSSILSGFIPGAILGFAGYEAYVGTEEGLERLLRHTGGTCAGDSYEKNRWKCPQTKEWYVTQTKYIEDDLKKVRNMNRQQQIIYGLKKGGEELLYMEALRNLGIDPSSLPTEFEPQPIKDYEFQGVTIGTILGGALGAAQYLSKKGSEKLRSRIRKKI